MIKVLILLLSLLLISSSYCQTAVISFHNISFQDSISIKKEKEYRGKSIFLYLYKYIFSSQDAQSCNFYPSCSIYAVESLKEKGLIKGSLNTIDRLSRCHTLSQHFYKKHEISQLPFDPVNE